MKSYRIEHCSILQLTEEQIRQLDTLHLPRGLMWPRFQDCINDGTPSDVFLCWDGDTIVGWSHVYSDYCTVWYHTFVNPQYRRQGIGTLLYNAANKKFSLVTVSRWNKESRLFYDSVHQG